MSCSLRGHHLNNDNHSHPICCHKGSLHTKNLSSLCTHQYLQKKRGGWGLLKLLSLFSF